MKPDEIRMTPQQKRVYELVLHLERAVRAANPETLELFMALTWMLGTIVARSSDPESLMDRMVHDMKLVPGSFRQGPLQ